MLNSPPNAPTLSGPTWSNGSFTVNWTFSDPDAGNTQSAMQVQVGSDSAFTTIISDSGKTTQTTGSYALNFTSEGPKYCRVRVWDNVDSVSGWSNTVTVNVDRTAPVIGSASPLQYANAFNTSVAFQAITVSDDWSGIDHVTFSFYNPSNSLVSSANGTQSGTTWSKTFTGVTNAEGQWRADIVAYDTAGNASAAQSAYLIVDVTPPVIGSGDGNRYSSQTSGTIRHDIYSVSDTTSGMQKVTVSYRKSVNNGSTWGAYTGPVNATASAGTWYYDVPITGDGYYQVDFTAYDNAGNVRPVYTMFTTVDGTLAADPSLPIAQADIGRTTATFRWSAFSDPVPSSGYNHTSFWLGQWDGTNWVGGSPNLYNGAVVTSNGATLSYAVTGLLEGVRYRYTVAHFDNAGNQSGFTWREFYTKKKIGEFHVGSKTNTALAVPVYDPQTIPYSAARIEANGIVGCFELVDTTATNASPERVATPYGIKSIAT